MKQTSVRDWKIGDTTPSRANVLAIAKATGYLAGYIEDGALPKKAAQTDDLDLAELLDVWSRLRAINRGKLLQMASDLLSKQFPDPTAESSELHPRPS